VVIKIMINLIFDSNRFFEFNSDIDYSENIPNGY
jgi:hypothetical protein